MQAEPEPDDPERLRDRVHERDVLAELAHRLVQRSERRAGELELTAGLERDRAAVALESDELPGVGERLPAVLALDRREQRVDAALALVGNGPQRLRVQAELLVLGADPPVRARGVSPSRK